MSDSNYGFGFTLAIVGIFAAIIGVVYGWVHNIMLLIPLLSEPLSGMEIVRILGVFPLGFVGVVLGFIGN